MKYVVAVAEAKSITKAAAQLYLSQPSLSNAIKELEAETGIAIFLRSRNGVSLTKDGMEFLGNARQVLQQMELLEDKYIAAQPRKIRFGVSTQHYTFTENAFVELVQRFGQERYAFYFNEAGTHQILEDVKNRISDLGILYLSEENEAVLRKTMDEYGLEFVFLFSDLPHVFLQRKHPLAQQKSLKLSDLAPYPRLNFVQGSHESSYYAEELFSAIPIDKEIRLNDRGTIVNFMLGLNAYTISSGVSSFQAHSTPKAGKGRSPLGRPSFAACMSNRAEPYAFPVSFSRSKASASFCAPAMLGWRWSFK